MTKRTVWLSASIATSAAILTFSVARLARGQQGSQSWKEFSIRRVERSISLASGNVRGKTAIEAQRADGSKVTAEVGGEDGTRVLNRFIKSVPGKTNIFVDDGLAAFTTHYELAGLPHTPPRPESQCGFATTSARLKPVFKGVEEILGFKTLVIQMEDGPYLTTFWKAPDLDCASLKMTEDNRGTGVAPTGRFELAAVSVTLGPPAPALFDIPATYSEKSPLQMAEASATRAGRTVPEKVLRTLQLRESKYIENHSRAAALR